MQRLLINSKRSFTFAWKMNWSQQLFKAVNEDCALLFREVVFSRSAIRRVSNIFVIAAIIEIMRTKKEARKVWMVS